MGNGEFNAEVNYHLIQRSRNTQSNLMLLELKNTPAV